MASANAELAQSAYDALIRNDIDAFLELIDPEVEWHSLILEMEGTFHGHEGVRRWWESLRSAFPEWAPSFAEVEDRGDWVIARASATGSGAASGVELEGDFWQVAEVREGLIVRYFAVRGRDEAMRVIEDARAG